LPARLAKVGESIEQDRIQTGRGMRAALEARHPDRVTQQEMVQRAVHATKKGAEIAPVLVITELGASGVQALVGEAIVAGVLRPGLRHLPSLTRSTRGDGNPAREIANQAGDDGAAQAMGLNCEGLDLGGWTGRASRTWDSPKLHRKVISSS
jgi:hypothetical protein